MVRSGALRVVGAVRRQLWAAALVIAVVSAIAIMRYAGPGAAARQRYVASQTLVVQALPPDGGGVYAAATTQALGERLALELAAGAPVSQLAFGRATAAQVAQDHALVAAHFGAGSAAPLDILGAQVVADALSASVSGDRVTVTSHWPTAAGAWALVNAAGETLTADPDGMLGPMPAAPEGASLRVVALGPVTSPALDPAPGQAARLRLVETLLLGLVGGVAVAFVLDQWPMWRRDPATQDDV
jgi:hypothetical protein